MKLIHILLRYSRGPAILAIVVGCLSGLASTALLAVLNSAIHRSAQGTSGELLLPFLGLAVLFAAARLLSGYLLDRVSLSTVFGLRSQLSWDILGTPLNRLESIGSHRLTAVLTSDIGSIAGALQRLSPLCINLAILLGGLAYLGWLSWKVLLVVAVILPFGVVTYQLPNQRARIRQREAREVTDKVFEHYRGVTEGAKELQLNRQRRHAFMARLDEAGLLFQKLRIESMTLFRLASTWGQLLLFLLIGTLVFYLSQAIGLPQPTVTGAALVLLYILNPLQSLLDTLPELAQAAVAVENVEKLGFSLARGRGDRTADPEPVLPVAALELCGVRYRHPGEEELGFGVGPIDLRLEPGELVFVTGGNGSGKTTLAKLITGLYTPVEGQIRLNGRAITPKTLEWCRQHVSAVFSDFYLFRELLGLGQSSGLAGIQDLLTRLQLRHKVRIEDGSFTTLSLSQGQRKRLALLTTWLEDRPLVLFDEWAADQDPVFRDFFYTQVLPQLKEQGKTVVVISHDDRYYGIADRVLKLDQGTILSEETMRPPRVAMAVQGRVG
ncbi:MAG TPA: cyclic peptide export ABC transporter [Thermoanaerobaculia bacterium]|nr:cyclic peptide export ABC transporter [Thermoanaerobaculia bacterium]